MNNNRKRHVLLALILALAGLAFAQEAGIDSTTRTSLGNMDTTVFTLNERLDGWWKVPMGTGGSIFEGSAHFGMGFDAYADSDASPNGESVDGVLSGDLDRCRLAFVLPKPISDMKSMNFEVGRLLVLDPTGLIVSHPADGALFGFDWSALKVSVQAGFTRYILRNANSISLSLFDRTASSDDSRAFGTSRLLVLSQVDFPEIAGQTINFSFLAQQDLNPESEFIEEWMTEKYAENTAKGGKLDTQYTSIKISGPIMANLFYDAWFSYGSGRTLSWQTDADSATGYSYQYVPISSFMTGVSFDYYRSSLMNSAFNFRFLFASGDSDSSAPVEGNTSGDATQFLPITGTTLGAVFSPDLSNLIVAELSGSVKPIPQERIQTGIKLLAFFRPTEAPLEVSGLKAGDDSSWLGLETDIFGTYRLTSDFGLSLNSGLFFPGVSPSGAFDSSGSPVRYSVQLSATLGM